MNFSILFLGLAIVFALLDWLAVIRKIKTLEYIAKPGVMVALLVWLWLISGFRGGLSWFGLGLFFSLLGDVFLMLPKEQFVPGLVSFLMAHIAYIAGFTPNLPPTSLPALGLALLVTFIAAPVYRRVRNALIDKEEDSLIRPVLIYTNVISLMLLTALLTLLRPEWAKGPALLASLGALLFFFSDGVLAWNKFVAPLPWGRLAVIVSYHIGQILIALGAASHYLLG